MTRPVELTQVKEKASFEQILQHYSLAGLSRRYPRAACRSKARAELVSAK
jgi:hypothetical protein